VRRAGNHLVGSASAYLLAHAHDPVDWYPWSAEALDRAKRENKPVFLSIGYVACHWCHVMHDEVFSKDDVAALLNERFVSIKVDREERPDLDRTYIGALDTLTGSAGWPATLFLTPALEPFYGATYLPKERFVAAATRASDAHRAGSEDVSRTTRDLMQALAPPPLERSSALLLEDIHAVATAATGAVDLARGGFKGTTKFPLPVRWTFLLHAVRKWGDDATARAVRSTLDAMAGGALRDPVSGGFHRYSTDPTWRTPHYEIMLYDDAQLADLYLEAGLAFGEPRYLDVAKETLDFLVRDMTTPAGTFAASFDADTAGVEGAAWMWSRSELVALLGPSDGAAVATLLDVGDGPPRAPRLGATPAAMERTWTEARPKLRAARAGKASRDDKLVTAWNGLAIAALARGAFAIGNAPWRLAALRAAEAVWRSSHEEPKHLLRTERSDAALDDYACLADAFLSLFEIGAGAEWLDRAAILVDEARARYAAKDGAFYASDAPPPFPRVVPLEDGAEPSGNAVLLHVLVRLARLDPRRAEWGNAVASAFSSYGDALRTRGIVMAGWLDAALLDAGPFYEVVVAGPIEEGPLDRIVRDVGAPWLVSLRVPAEGASADLARRVPAAADKTSPNGWRAFVCERGTCKLPTNDPAVLRRQLLGGWTR
jgi:uncharacterized protein YyaL (SSP411 family)